MSDDSGDLRSSANRSVYSACKEHEPVRTNRHVATSVAFAMIT